LEKRIGNFFGGHFFLDFFSVKQKFDLQIELQKKSPPKKKLDFFLDFFPVKPKIKKKFKNSKNIVGPGDEKIE
jgi:hypothetical protein